MVLPKHHSASSHRSTTRGLRRSLRTAAVLLGVLVILNSYGAKSIWRSISNSTNLSSQAVTPELSNKSREVASSSLPNKFDKSTERLQKRSKIPIDKQTLKRIAPSHPEWSDKAIHEEFQNVLKKIRDAEILQTPFDHFEVPNLFSEEFYRALMHELPPVNRYKEAKYPGTGPTYNALHLAESIPKDGHIDVPEQCSKHKNKCWKSGKCSSGKSICWEESVSLHDMNQTKGRTLTVDTDVSSYPLWAQAFRFIHSRNFTHLLYNKFATDTGIPKWKQEEVVKHGTKLRNSAALRIEPTQYHLTPHIDRSQKLVTWQFFHPETRELEDREVGTLFYEFKPHLKDVDMDDRADPPWLDYSHFNQVKEIPVVPNRFFAFAPNKHSFHGAAIDPIKMKGVNRFARRTFLGFITSAGWDFHHFNQDDWAPHEFDFVLE